MKTIQLKFKGYTFTLQLGAPDPRHPGRFSGGTIQSQGLKPEPDVDFDKCADTDIGEAAIDGLEALLLAMAVEGIDLRTPAMRRAIQTAVDAIGNHIA
jgi:hypothetical protein